MFIIVENIIKKPDYLNVNFKSSIYLVMIVKFFKELIVIVGRVYLIILIVFSVALEYKQSTILFLSRKFFAW